MTTLTIFITQAGRQALTDAQGTGMLPLTISEVALGTGKWQPVQDDPATSLVAEIKRIAAVGGSVIEPGTLHVTITDSSADAYALGEVGLYLNTGVLFAIYSSPAGITDKAADAMLLEAWDVLFTSIPAGAVTIGGTGFNNPPATETIAGVAQLATQAEANEGTDDSRIVTPAKAKAAAAAYAYTADQALATPANTGTLAQLFGWIAGRLMAITGKTDWKTAPATTLEAAKSHMDSTAPHSATSAAAASRLMMRDVYGRAKVAAPSAADDIARKQEVDAHATAAAPHSGHAPSAHSHDAAHVSSGTLPGERGVQAGSSSRSFVRYNGTTKSAGFFYGGTSAPTNTNQLNFDGNLYATRFVGGWSGKSSGTIYPMSDNTFTCGTAGYRWKYIWAATGTIQTSDERDKTDIQDSPLGLEFIERLRAVCYRWAVGGSTSTTIDDGFYEIEEPVYKEVTVNVENIEIIDGRAVRTIETAVKEVPVMDAYPLFDDAGKPILDDDGNPRIYEVQRVRIVRQPRQREEFVTKPGKRIHFGLLSQQVRQVLDDLGVEDFGGWVLTDANDPESQQALRYDQFIAPLIRAVQQLADRVRHLEAQQTDANAPS